MKRHPAQQPRHGVGELNFIAGAAFPALQLDEDFRRQNVAANNTQIRGGFRRFGLFHDPQHFGDRALAGSGGNHPVTLSLFPRLFLCGHNHTAADIPVGVHHLFQCTGLANHQVVRQHNRKWFIPNQMLCAQNRMSQAERLLLPCKRYRSRVGQAFEQTLQLLSLLARRK